MHNVHSYHKEQEEAKQRIRDSQQRMKLELEKQVYDAKRAKEDERRKEMEFFKQQQLLSEQQ